MICLRCGYCCIMYEVIIIDPTRVTSNLDFTDDSIYIPKHTGIKCPHLSFINGKAVCKIHHYDWFKFTPCHQFTQIGKEESVCRVGNYILNPKNKDIYQKILNSPEFAEVNKKENNK